MSLWLVKQGIPFDVALAAPDDIRLAFTIIMAGFEGMDFDYNRLRFVRRRED